MNPQNKYEEVKLEFAVLSHYSFYSHDLYWYNQEKLGTDSSSSLNAVITMIGTVDEWSLQSNYLSIIDTLKIVPKDSQLQMTYNFKMPTLGSVPLISILGRFHCLMYANTWHITWIFIAPQWVRPHSFRTIKINTN